MKKKNYKKQTKKCNCKAKKRIVLYTSIISAVLLVGIILGLGFGVFGWGKGQFKVTHTAKIEIENYGTVELELYGEEAPITVENFVTLAESGFYNGLSFYRVLEDHYIQGGSMTKSAGTIKGEFLANGTENNIRHTRGTISLSHPSDDYNGGSANFFIIHETNEANTKTYDGQYAAFGKVTSGMKIIDKIAKLPTLGEQMMFELLPANQPKIVRITVEKVI